jgi:hypothetical protein
MREINEEKYKVGSKLKKLAISLSTLGNQGSDKRLSIFCRILAFHTQNCQNLENKFLYLFSNEVKISQGVSNDSSSCRKGRA